MPRRRFKKAQISGLGRVGDDLRIQPFYGIICCADRKMENIMPNTWRPNAEFTIPCRRPARKIGVDLTRGLSWRIYGISKAQMRRNHENGLKPSTTSCTILVRAGPRNCFWDCWAMPAISVWASTGLSILHTAIPWAWRLSRLTREISRLSGASPQSFAGMRWQWLSALTAPVEI